MTKSNPGRARDNHVTTRPLVQLVPQPHIDARSRGGRLQLLPFCQDYYGRTTIASERCGLAHYNRLHNQRHGESSLRVSIQDDEARTRWGEILYLPRGKSPPRNQPCYATPQDQ